MAIKREYIENFEILVRAMVAGDVCLLECLNKKTAEKVNVICTVHKYKNEFGEIEGAAITPFAKMFNSDPYDELLPPDPDGGFVSGSGMLPNDRII